MYVCVCMYTHTYIYSQKPVLFYDLNFYIFREHSIHTIIEFSLTQLLLLRIYTLLYRSNSLMLNAA